MSGSKKGGNEENDLPFGSHVDAPFKLACPCGVP